MLQITGQQSIKGLRDKKLDQRQLFTYLEEGVINGSNRYSKISFIEAPNLEIKYTSEYCVCTIFQLLVLRYRVSNVHITWKRNLLM